MVEGKQSNVWRLAEMAEVVNKSFQSVFTIERTFVGQSEMSKKLTRGEIQVTGDVWKQLDVRNVPEPDEVFGWKL